MAAETAALDTPSQVEYRPVEAATSDARTTLARSRPIDRFVRPLCHQNPASELLPPELPDKAGGK